MKINIELKFNNEKWCDECPCYKSNTESSYGVCQLYNKVLYIEEHNASVRLEECIKENGL